MDTAVRSTEAEILDAPQSFNEARQRIQHVAERNALYANQIAQEFKEEADNLNDSDFSEEEMDREWDRMSTNAKNKINSAIDEATTFLKSLVNEARRKLGLNGVQTRQLMICAGESFGFAERALMAVLDLLKDAFTKLRDGIIKLIEAVKSFAVEVAELVGDAVSAIRQFFSPGYPGGLGI